MIHVIATIELKPGGSGEFLKIFHALMPKVQAEPGCLEYGPAMDLCTGMTMQAPLRDDVVVIMEKWQDLAVLKTHLGTPHMVAYRRQVQDLVKGVKLQILEPV